MCYRFFCCSKAGLGQLVEYNRKKVFDVKLKELKSSLTDQISEETDMTEVIESVKKPPYQMSTWYKLCGML